MRKLLTYVIFVSISIVSSAFDLAAQTVGESEVGVDAIRQDVSRFYGPPAKKVSVKLRSGATIKGFVDAVASDTFKITNDDTGRTVEIRYADVERIKRIGNGLSKNQKTALIVGATVGTLVVLGLVFRKKRDPWRGSRCGVLC